MIDRPLLLFPSPHLVKRSNLNSNPSKIHKPDPSRQIDRFYPKLIQLVQSFEAKKVSIQQTATGIDPEMVLVIEIIGSIDNFVRAVRRIDGFEWLGEIEYDNILPNEDFFNPKNPKSSLNGRLFLIMSNHEAMKQLLSLYKKFKNNSKEKFPTNYGRYKELFLCLNDIRYWGVQERYYETGIIEYWEEYLEQSGHLEVCFEIELWYRSSEEKRRLTSQNVNGLIQELNGNIISECIIKDISYHALLVKLPANKIREIIQDPNIRLVECDGIMYFRPIGQMAVGKRVLDEEFSDVDFGNLPTPFGDPVIAVLDGLPVENHHLLSNRLIVDDPDNWAGSYPVQKREHGTAMASLICHGDLNNGSHPLPRPIYIRPILKHDELEQGEVIPESDELSIDLICRAVRRICGDENGKGAVAPSVKIINFSIGDESKIFFQTMSPMARCLDWLSSLYDILFIISAGNQMRSVETNLSNDEFEKMSHTEVEKIVVRSLYEDERNRRLLAPAECINGLTVGALNYDNSEYIQLDDRIEPFENILPSPISAFGRGYLRSIKPDLLYSGGKVCFKKNIVSNSVLLDCYFSGRAPGIKAATPGRLLGDIYKCRFESGTSLSTALISHDAGFCYESLCEILEEQHEKLDYEPYIAQLLKTLIVHGCSWGEVGDCLSSHLKPHYKSHQVKQKVAQWLGYGIPDIQKVLECTEQRATALGFGELNNGEAHVFTLPLPPSLSGTKHKRKLTITLGWLSPIAPNTQKYRIAHLWFDVGNKPLQTKRAEADHNDVRRGTVQHEIFEGDAAFPIIDGEKLKIQVNCREFAGKIIDPVKYGLAVTLEIAEGVDIPIYDEIMTRIAPAIRIQPGAEDLENV